MGLVKNIMGNGENAGYQNLLLFLLCFPMASFSMSIKVGIVWSKISLKFLPLAHMPFMPLFASELAFNEEIFKGDNSDESIHWTSK